MAEQKCIMCNNNLCKDSYVDGDKEIAIYDCPVCGRYITSLYQSLLFDKSYIENPYDPEKTAAYMFYHNYRKYPFYLGEETCFNSYKRAVPQTEAKFLASSDIENWYPTTINEKIEKILLKLKDLSQFDGATISVSYRIVRNLFFVHLKDCSDEVDEEIVAQQQIEFIVDALIELNYISVENWDELKSGLMGKAILHIIITPKGLAQIYHLQKKITSNKNVFVAMKFGDATYDLREKIKQGIRTAGYEPRIMDEIEHNHQIVPEMLYEIKNSRFVIAELSHHNNGAYYEAGFAYGLNKEVIHICSEDALKSDLHFDVAQINTITYSNIDEIPEKLKRRIQATII